MPSTCATQRTIAAGTDETHGHIPEDDDVSAPSTTSTNVAAVMVYPRNECGLYERSARLVS